MAEESLQKMASGMHVRYSNGGYSNNLNGKNFKFTQRDGAPCLGIDMSGNTHVRNKQQNCYLDALELLERHASLEHLQLDHGHVVEDFVKRAKTSGYAGRGCKLELGFAERGTLLFTVSKMERSGKSVAFAVSFCSAALVSATGQR
jgi:hypothetical protein